MISLGCRLREWLGVPAVLSARRQHICMGKGRDLLSWLADSWGSGEQHGDAGEQEQGREAGSGPPALVRPAAALFVCVGELMVEHDIFFLSFLVDGSFRLGRKILIFA